MTSSDIPSDAVLVERQDGVIQLTLNVPRNRNSLQSPGVYEGLMAGLDELERNPRLRAAIITGAGGAFCSGGDLRTLAQGSEDEVRATMGQMRFRQAEDAGRQFGTLMIRHPNFSGLQRDQVSLLTIPAEFIQVLEVTQAGTPLFTMEAGISISEDPVFRFGYAPGDGAVTVHAQDTDGRVWDQSF